MKALVALGLAIAGIWLTVNVDRVAYWIALTYSREQILLLGLAAAVSLVCITWWILF